MVKKERNDKLKVIGVYGIPNGGKEYVVYHVKGRKFVPGAPKFYAELVPLIEGKKVDGITNAARISLLRKTSQGHLERCIKKLTII